VPSGDILYCSGSRQLNHSSLKLQLLPATSQDSGQFIFEQDCCSAQNTLFYDINISQGSAATVWGEVGYLMIHSLQMSRRLWQWKNFENRPVFDEVMCRLRWLTFLAHPDSINHIHAAWSLFLSNRLGVCWGRVRLAPFRRPSQSKLPRPPAN